MTIFYRLGIHVLAKWQFWSNTHLPYDFPFFISLVAGTPWPWPKEIISSSCSDYEENLSKAEVGSAPGDKTKIIGVL